MIDTFLLAFGLAMDAFAISLALGANSKYASPQLAIRCALFFGVAQGVMPAIGYIGGSHIIGLFQSVANIVACVALILIGMKMIVETQVQRKEEEKEFLTNKVMFTLAIATSIDALVAGFTLHLSAISPVITCVTIGVVTAVMSFIGVHISRNTQHALGTKANILGGIILICLGIKFVI